MPVKLSEIIAKMEEFAPTCLAESWDNVGLVVGDPKKEVKSILVALDPTFDVIALGISKGVDLILTHHPILFSKTNKITPETTDGAKIISLIKNDIALYCAHTNLDQTGGGVEDTLAELLGIQNYKILEQKNVWKEQPRGYGRVGNITEKSTLFEYAQRVKKQLGLEAIQVVGDPEHVIERVASACGSGSLQMKQAIINRADVLVTGDIKYHTANDALEIGICLIDGTHYGTERHCVRLIGKYLCEEFSKIIIFEDETQESPMKTI